MLKILILPLLISAMLSCASLAQATNASTEIVARIANLEHIKFRDSDLLLVESEKLLKIETLSNVQILHLLSLRSTAFSQQGLFLAAKSVSKKGIMLAEKYNIVNKHYGNVLLEYGLAIYTANDEEILAQTRAYIEKVLKLSDEIEDKLLQVNARIYSAYVYGGVNNGEMEVKELNMADALLNKLPDSVGKKVALKALKRGYWLIYFYSHQDKEAVLLAKEVIALCLEVGLLDELPVFYSSLANNYEYLKDYELAEKYYNKSLHYATKEYHVRDKLSTYMKLVNLETISEERALGLFKKAEALLGQQHDYTRIEKIDVLDFYYEKSKYLLSIKEYGGALDAVENARTYVGNISESVVNADNIFLLRQYSYAKAGLGHYEEAYSAHVKYEKLLSQYRDDMAKEEVNAIKLNYEKQKKTAINEALSHENKIKDYEIKKAKQQEIEWTGKMRAMVFALVVFSLMLIRQLFLQKKLRFAAERDGLTKIWNRAAILQRSKQVIEQQEKDSNSLHVVLLDIDDFKSVNDNYSHEMGDRVLIKVAQISNSVIRNTDIFGRWGGEEFVAVFSGNSDKQTLELCERLRVAYEKYPWKELGLDRGITASIGVFSARNVDKYKGIEEMVSLADEAMYQSKRTGKNKVTLKKDLM